MLCCEVCGAADGSVRKRSCSYGYCQATALCTSCRSDGSVLASLRDYCDAHCLEASRVWAAECAAKDAALASGAHVFCSALNAGSLVACSFRDAAGALVTLEVSREVYEALRSLRAGTLEDAREMMAREGVCV